MTNQMITARGLTKTFRAKGQPVEAVRDVDLAVEAGELVAFLGPNGAGKSTTLRMLTTLLPPTAGEATVAGCDIRLDPAGVRRRIGYVGQGDSGGHSQRVRDELHAQGAFYGLGRRETRVRAAELVESLELGQVANRQVQSLSGGQKRRVDIALGLLHRPELLFLDEPSTGLDPHSRANLWEHIIELRRTTGTTIFLTTHYLDEADELAERVMVMDHGRVIADDTAPALKQQLGGDRVTLAFGSASDAAAAASHVGGEVHGAVVTVTAPDGDRALPRWIRGLAADGLEVTAATHRAPTLDDVFLALTGRSLREEGATPGSDEAASDEPAAA
ncbi:ABC-2 type transport system ATP-binding protein [Agromyces flavus]|uniref:ABC-2 type transport system ATP-binding protein n=1 Tax=Agromyces flavus TaxID=589382 RepID=A0A1H1YEW8_9MICO|nr:ATP-binding cassette domain-containing protein [Agromyces flavus]MCP2366669.1 ABC-2 type transport system ATP-binding protein [Agromyces flavus]GGI45138.1 ABC transporter [Agromyces flavus]SDT20000.1 ABC-2 type transport system ATP-binding protein [Agromyces flavus]